VTKSMGNRCLGSEFKMGYEEYGIEMRTIATLW
jgi:hypothetical protein